MNKSASAKPRMSADEARSFGRFSVANAALVASHLDCACDPYADVFTFKRWIAQGRVVQRGQHGIKLPIILERERERDGKSETGRMFASATVFCRCQTGELESKAVAA